jgi:hypothetical protein
MIWLEPWHSVAEKPAESASMERELEHELAPGHPLFGVLVETFGRRYDRDDVVYRLLDGSGRIAVVHLTWTRSPPDRPPWPSTTFYDTQDLWIAECMRPVHQEFAEPGTGPFSSDL